MVAAASIHLGQPFAAAQALIADTDTVDIVAVVVVADIVGSVAAVAFVAVAGIE